MPKPVTESRAWSASDIAAALTGAGAMAASGIQHLASEGRHILSPQLLLTAAGALATLTGCTTPKPTQEIIQTPDQSLRHLSGLDISTIGPSADLPSQQQIELAKINTDFVTAASSNKLIFPKSETDSDQPLTQGGLIDAVTYALGKTPGTISADAINPAFLPNVIKFGTEGEFDIQPVVVKVDGEEQMVLFGRADGTNWGLIAFIHQPFDVFSSLGNGIDIQGPQTMSTAFVRGTSFNFTGMVLSGGKNGAVFSHALYFEIDRYGKLQLVLRDNQGTLSGPIQEQNPIIPNQDGVFNASYISHPYPTPETPVETGPEGTTVKTDYLGNKYSVDTEGIAQYWFNTETNQWAVFELINWRIGDPNVGGIVRITSGRMEYEIKQAIKFGTETGYQPIFPDALYIRSSSDWERSYLHNFDELGVRRLMPSSDYFLTEIKGPGRYPIQPTWFSFFVNYNGESFRVITEILHIQAPDGTKIQKPIFIYFPESIYKNDFYVNNAKVRLFEELLWPEFNDSGFRLIGLPLIEFDPDKIDQQQWNQLFDSQRQFLQGFFDFYQADQQLPFFAPRKALLERLLKGDMTALDDLGKYLLAPVPTNVKNVP